MRRVVSAFIIIGLLFVIGCDKNDEDVINSIPKAHLTYPIFKLAFDNGYKTFGVDSALITVNPGIGWLDDVYSNEFGQIPTQSAGTFVTGVDTLVDVIDTTVNPHDTTWIHDSSFVNFGFTPSASYSFSFARSDPYVWIDSFRIDYLSDYDSVWKLISADTQFVMTVPDNGISPEVIIDSVALTTAVDTMDVNKKADSIYIQEVFKAVWLDTTFILSSADDTLVLAPDSFFTDTLIWGFWNAIDSFFLPFDSGDWCQKREDSSSTPAYDTFFTNGSVDSIDTNYNQFFVIRDSIFDINGFLVFTLDTVIEWVNCQDTVDSSQMRIYSDYGWGEFDTTQHFTFPDTTKGMIFRSDAVDVYTWYILPDSSDTISDTTFSATISLITTIGTVADTTTLSDLTDIPLTMPSVEVYPDFRIMITDD